MIIKLTINNSTYSDYRLKQMFGTKEDATKLRGWDRLKEWVGFGDKGATKKEQLKELYEKLYSDTRIDENGKKQVCDNLDKICVFYKMHELVNESNKTLVDFSLEVVKSKTGMSSDIVFKINGNKLLKTRYTVIDKVAIKYLENKNYIDKDCKLFNSPLTEEDIKEIQQKQKQEQEQVVTKLDGAIRGFLARRKEHPDSEAAVTMRRFIRDENGKVVEKEIIGYRFGKEVLPNPRYEVKNGPKGTYKRLTHISHTLQEEQNAKDKGLKLNTAVKLKKIRDQPIPDAGNIAAINKMKELPSFVLQYRINKRQLVTKNLGKKDLFNLLNTRQYLFSHSHFFQAADDLGAFHEAGFRHRDLKEKNMMFKDDMVYFIDHDSAGKPGEFVVRTGTLNMNTVNPDCQLGIDNRLEFSLKAEQQQFLFTMIRCWLGINYCTNFPTKDAIFKFVEKFIKPAYQEQIKKFLLAPESTGIGQMRRDFFVVS